MYHFNLHRSFNFILLIFDRYFSALTALYLLFTYVILNCTLLVMKALKSQLHTWSGSSNTLPRPTPAPPSGRSRWLPRPWRSARRQSPSSVPNQFKIYQTSFTRLIRFHWSLINSRSRIPYAYLNMIYILLMNNFNQSFNVSLFLHQSKIIMWQFRFVNQSIYSSAWSSKHVIWYALGNHNLWNADPL